MPAIGADSAIEFVGDETAHPFGSQFDADREVPGNEVNIDPRQHLGDAVYSFVGRGRAHLISLPHKRASVAHFSGVTGNLLHDFSRRRENCGCRMFSLLQT